MSQIGHSKRPRPEVEFADGCARVSDLTIAAALLAQSGAAWLGRDDAPLLAEPAAGDPARDSWLQRRDSPEGRVLRVELAGHHQATVPVQVIKREGWRGYKCGEFAPMQRVVYHLRGWYEFYTGAALTRRVPWTAEDWRFWVGEFFRPGGLLRAFERQADERNRLLNLNRDNYGIESRQPAATPTSKGDVWE